MDIGNQIEITEDISKYTILRAVPKKEQAYNQYKITPQNQFKLTIFKMSSFNMFLILSIVIISSYGCGQVAAFPDGEATENSSVADAGSSTVESTTNNVKICHSNTPCGWAVYIPFTRRVDYFMKNTCVCPSTKACIRSDDDLAVSAYVYRCGEKPAEPEITTYNPSYER